MNTIAQLIGAAFGETAPASLPPSPGRRRKLWELPTRWHCPLLGTCLPLAEMRKLVARAGFAARDMSDYSLHTVAVGQCDRRTDLANLIQRWLDKRHAAAIRRVSTLTDGAALLHAWGEAMRRGEDVAGALWACWTHPQMDDEDGAEIFGDIHMLSHQIGAGARADLGRLEQLKLENSRLRDQLQALRLGLDAAQRAKDQSLVDMQRRLTEAEQRSALLAHRELELAEARKAMRAHQALNERAGALAARAEALEERNAALARKAAALSAELNETQDALAAAETALEAALGVCAARKIPCGDACAADTALTGRCVLCIGGRTGLIDGYRRLVEIRGGRFSHHDGGQEESLHRIDAAVASADAVVCQSGCISHAAYFRLKEACKRLGKPCVFVQSPGVGSFARSLALLSGAAPSGQQAGLLGG